MSQNNSNKMERMSNEYLEIVADCLKLMAHPVRLRIVEILSQGRFAVHEIAEQCNVAPNQTCEHLRLMKNHGLLGSKRDGRTVYYNIISQQLVGLLSCIKKSCPCAHLKAKDI